MRNRSGKTEMREAFQRVATQTKRAASTGMSLIVKASAINVEAMRAPRRLLRFSDPALAAHMLIATS
jgi:hypothetical protein